MGISDRFSVKGRVVVTAVGLLCISLFLTAYSSKHPEVARAGSAVISEITAPVGRAVASVRAGARSAWSGYLYLRGVAAENDSLRLELGKIRGEVLALGELSRENARLRALLNFSQSSGLAGVAASVIGADATGWVRGIVVNQGSTSGVTVGMAAVHPQGVVGQVISVTPHSARVLLITDHSSSVDALVQETRVRGIIEGAGSSGCELRYVTKDAPVKSGELVVTSGFDRVYPKGLAIGRVSSVQSGDAGLFHAVRVKPAVDLQRLEEVLLVSAAPAPANGAQGGQS